LPSTGPLLLAALYRRLWRRGRSRPRIPVHRGAGSMAARRWRGRQPIHRGVVEN